MEVSVGKGLSIGAVITLMIILEASRCGATGTSVTEFNGSARFATIAANMELEFLMDSEIGRMLATENQYGTEATKDRNSPAVNCGRGKPYRPCTPTVNKDQKPPEKCSTYKRGCPSPTA